MITNVTQDRFFMDPTESSRGNCLQAATASLLGLRLGDVPNFHESPEGFWQGFDAFVLKHGFVVLCTDYDPCLDAFYLACGPSPRGARHSCVYRRGILAWDPHPSRAGILSVEDCRVLVPVAPSRWVDAGRSAESN
jgi:hypothetical protein